MPASNIIIRRGMTLVELLIVVAILLILVTAATTMMQVASDGAELREAARQVNAMIAACVARAAETGRPAGIWIDRVTGTPNAGREIFFANSPPLYSGDFLSSSCNINATTLTVSFSSAFVSSFYGVDGSAGTADDFVRPGDAIRFNFSGPWYPIATVPTAYSVTYTVGDRPAPLALNVVPYQIRRGPRKSLANPLQMPADTIIDLANSGAGVNGTEFAGGGDAVRIMFNPNGSIDRVYYNGSSSAVVDGVHLLIGRLTTVGAANLADQSARWVSLNPQTGTVISTENMGGALASARQFAITGKGMGGN